MKTARFESLLLFSLILLASASPASATSRRGDDARIFRAAAKASIPAKYEAKYQEMLRRLSHQPGNKILLLDLSGSINGDLLKDSVTITARLADDLRRSGSALYVTPFSDTVGKPFEVATELSLSQDLAEAYESHGLGGGGIEHALRTVLKPKGEARPDPGSVLVISDFTGHVPSYVDYVELLDSAPLFGKPLGFDLK
jgi:uncharacterized protein with von Willebrand factor type A (vWA) domain